MVSVVIAKLRLDAAGKGDHFADVALHDGHCAHWTNLRRGGVGLGLAGCDYYRETVALSGDRNLNIVTAHTKVAADRRIPRIVRASRSPVDFPDNGKGRTPTPPRPAAELLYAYGARRVRSVNMRASLPAAPPSLKLPADFRYTPAFGWYRAAEDLTSRRAQPRARGDPFGGCDGKKRATRSTKSSTWSVSAETSWEDAGRNAVETAAGSLRDLRVAEVDQDGRGRWRTARSPIPAHACRAFLQIRGLRPKTSIFAQRP